MSREKMNEYEIFYLEGSTSSGLKVWSVRASSAAAALKAFNKVMRKKSFRAVRVSEKA